MVISTDSGKTFDKIQHSYIIKKKTCNKLGLAYCQDDKGHL